MIIRHLNPDLTDPEVLAYVSDPAIIAYFADLEKFMTGFEAYSGELFNCLGEIQPYLSYVGLAGSYEDRYGYDPNAAEPLYSVFAFKNDDFEKGFKEGTASCMQAFAALFAMIQ